LMLVKGNPQGHSYYITLIPGKNYTYRTFDFI
ncbi:Hypothetical protein DEACI_3838, partial [Acididesulfobacillus acetoxydans]